MGNPIFSENSDYAAEFFRYLVEHPEEADRIPEGAVVVFLPEQRDPGLAAHNRLAVHSAEAYRDTVPVFITVRGSREVGKRYEFAFA